jgi:hypothetical protein
MFLPEFPYEDQKHLLASLKASVIGQVLKWQEATDKAAAKERMLRDEVEQKNAEIASLKAALLKASEQSQ